METGKHGDLTVNEEILTDYREGLDAGDLSASFIAQSCLDRMARLDPEFKAIAYQNPAASLAKARQADQRLQHGERTSMLGIPVVIKDNFNWKGSPSQHGSRITDGYQAPFNATVVQRLEDAGAIIVGKAHLDEFAMGSSGEFCAAGPSPNPFDRKRSPGGSSSGSALAVALDYAPFALGTDTGGSVRLPAAFCGVSALRPTYGVLSRQGVTAMASSLDQVGPIARSAKNLALGLSVMAGRDPLDSTSLDLPRHEALADLQPASLTNLRIGIPKEFFGEGLSPETKDVLNQALKVFTDAGAECVEISLPHTPYAIDTYYLINTAEVSSNLARFDGMRYGARVESDDLTATISETRSKGFGTEAKRRILLGAFGLSRGHYDAFYMKALKTRTLIQQDFEKAFEKVDVIFTPTSPGLPFLLGEKTQDPLAMYLADVYTVTMALAAIPALNLPAGFVGGLPVGMQLVGPALSDVRLLEIGHHFQQLTTHHLVRP